MRVYSAAEQAYLESGKPIGFWFFLRFTVKDGDGDPVVFDFSDMDDDETVTVIDPSDGSDSVRDYLGGGHVLDIEDITYVEGNQIVTTEIRLSALSEDVIDMVTNHNCARQRVEIHEGLINADSMQLVDKPGCVWFGVIDGIKPVKEAMAGETANKEYLVTVANHLREMDRGNTALRSKQVVAQRDGDGIGKYLREVGFWRLRHGMENKSEHDRRRGKRGGDSGVNRRSWGDR